MNKNTISGLGKKEAEIVSRLTFEEKDIVTSKELDEYLPSGYKYRNKLVYNLKKKNILIPIKNKVYIFVPMGSIPTGRRVNDLIIPSVFFPKNDYYIGYSTMFNYYNFMEQQFQTIFVLNTSISKKSIIAGLSYKFIKVSSNRIYGIKKINIRGREINISSKERTLVDLIYYNKPAGGIYAAGAIFERIVREEKCDIEKLIRYSCKFPVIKTRKYIGICLERAGISEILLKPLLKSVRNTSLISFSNSRKGKINKKWGVIYK